jgi:hypothetical protein
VHVLHCSEKTARLAVPQQANASRAEIQKTNQRTHKTGQNGTEICSYSKKLVCCPSGTNNEWAECNWRGQAKGPTTGNRSLQEVELVRLHLSPGARGLLGQSYKS